MLRIVYRIDDGDDFFLCGNDRQFLIKAEKRNLPPVPVLVKDVVIEIPQLTDKNVDRARIELSDILEILFV